MGGAGDGQGSLGEDTSGEHTSMFCGALALECLGWRKGRAARPYQKGTRGVLMVRMTRALFVLFEFCMMGKEPGTTVGGKVILKLGASQLRGCSRSKGKLCSAVLEECGLQQRRNAHGRSAETLQLPARGAS